MRIKECEQNLFVLRLHGEQSAEKDEQSAGEDDQIDGKDEHEQSSLVNCLLVGEYRQENSRNGRAKSQRRRANDEANEQVIQRKND